jgi:hypothetical protein
VVIILSPDHVCHPGLEGRDNARRITACCRVN